MNQVLVVTCNRDRWLFLIQCKSMGKFLDPCTINIVINETHSQSWIAWFTNNCKKYLANHLVTIYTHEDFFDDLDFSIVHKTQEGWVTQQIFKLAFALKTSSEYMVLDSKNWFVRKTNLLEIYPRLRRWKDHNYTFNKFVDSCNANFNLAEETAYRPAITPYKFNPDIVKKLFLTFGGVNKFMSWFVSFRDPSEFIVYDLYAQSIGQEQDSGSSRQVCFNIFHGNIDTVEAQCYSNELDLMEFSNIIAQPHTKMITASVVLLQEDRVRQAVEHLLPLD